MSDKPQLNPLLKIALDLGPLLLFFYANSKPALFEPWIAPLIPRAVAGGESAGIFVATAVFMVAIVVALAVLNEIVWRTQSTDTWVTFKVFGVMPLTFVFAALQYPLLTKHAASPKDETGR